MIVTRVIIRLTDPRDPFYPKGVRAFADIIFDECFQVEGIRLVQKYDGSLHVAMPSRLVREKYHDVAHPITSVARRDIDRSVLDKYRALTTAGKGATISP